jgi:hypothetical protein
MMKGIRALALCVSLACGVLVFGATGAFAENLPHYGKCVAKAGGPYKTGGCTKLGKTAEEMKFEWQPLTTTVGFKSKKEKETGPAVLESQGGTKISCTEQVEKEGEYGPGDQVKNVVGEFSGCEALGFKCESEGKSEGLINTKKLIGEPGIVTKETKEEKNIDGNDLRAENEPGGPNGFLAEFSCGGAPVKVKGGVVVKAQQDSTGGTSGEVTNKMENKIEVEFVAEAGGKQNPEEWTPNGAGFSNKEHKLINEHLESSLSGGAYERGGQSLITVQETIGKVKVELRQCEKTISCPN